MATYLTGTTVGIREDLQNTIYRLNVQDHPFMTSIGTGVAKARRHDWQTDDVGPATKNQKNEGKDRGSETITPTVRPQNALSIASYEPQVSGSNNAVDAAGRDREQAYQDLMYGLRIANDIEFMAMTGEEGSDFSEPQKAAGFESWVSTHAHHEGAGDTPGYNPGTGVVGAVTDGTPTAFLEDPYKAQIEACWTSGGDTNLHIMPMALKSKFSSFNGNATRYRDIPKGMQDQITAGADLYVSNAGAHSVVPSRYIRATTVSLVDTRYWAIHYLRPIGREEYPKGGDHTASLVLAEWTLAARNEASSGKVADQN